LRTIRDAAAHDARGIAEVHVRAWHQGYADLMPKEVLDGLSVDNRERAWRELLDGGESRTLVAEVDSSVAGFATFLRSSRDDDAGPAMGEIAALYVDPAHWRHGIGAALLRQALSDLSYDGAEQVSVYVLEGNAPAIAFYERAGFEADGARAPHEPSGRDQLRYRMRLTR
jgi:ribosomal protein S18 acetylase RimI-like enzyme